ncbi:hypothetical protein AMTRI_Chr06g192350 [Amborella trichopoda]
MEDKPHFNLERDRFLFIKLEVDQTMEEEVVMVRPPWLKPLLGTSFFRQCKSHGNSNKSDCNMFYLDCISGALCSPCLIVHRHHRIIQVPLLQVSITLNSF